MPSAYLPYEVIFNILLLLSVKDLLRFRCVSKYWCALINESDFIKKHLKRSIESNTNVSLILREDRYCTGVCEVDLDKVRVEYNTTEVDGCPFKSRYINHIIGSCNGLVCLSTEDNHFAIWNPSTRKSYELPTMLGCDYGFGHDRYSDDYKIIGLQLEGFTDLAYRCIINVYSLKTKSWTKISRNMPHYVALTKKWGVFVSIGNALHWIMKRSISNNQPHLIGAFDLGIDNEYHEIQQPDYKFQGAFLTLGVLRECLCVFSCGSSSSDLWVMKEYGVKESWTRLLTIMVTNPAAPCLKKRPLAYSRCGGKVLVHDISNCKLIWYDLKTETATNVELLDSVDICLGEVCVQSLVPV